MQERSVHHRTDAEGATTRKLSGKWTVCGRQSGEWHLPCPPKEKEVRTPSPKHQLYCDDNKEEVDNEQRPMVDQSPKALRVSTS